MTLHILTLTWNGIDLLTNLKNSLLPSLEGLDAKWHIKDNGSTDGTEDVARTWGSDVVCYDYVDNNHNFAEGMNWLFHQAKPEPDDLVMLLNNDITFKDTDSIRNMIDTFHRNNAAVVGARMFYPGGNIIQHAGVIFESRYMLPIHYRAGQQVDRAYEADREFQAVTGALVILKAKNYITVSTVNRSNLFGMDEKYKWCYEDIDLCLAIRARTGQKVICCGSTDVDHGESVSLKKNPINRLFLPQNVAHFRNKWLNKFTVDGTYYNDVNHGLLK